LSIRNIALHSEVKQIPTEACSQFEHTTHISDIS